MRASWVRLIAGEDDLRPVRSSIIVTFANGRSHQVSVDDGADGYTLEAVVAGRRETSRLNRPELDAWRRNRNSRVVGYRIDGRGRLSAHAWTPHEGITAGLFVTIVRAVAREADRYEILVTGADRT